MPTIGEVQALTDEMPDSLRLAVTLAAWGALRRGEMLALRRRDVDPLRSTVRVERAQVELSNGTVISSDPKLDAGIRTVHLPEYAIQSVETHLEKYVAADPNALLFTGRGGVPLRPKTLISAFQKARTICGLPTTRFHDLRHFFDDDGFNNRCEHERADAPSRSLLTRCGAALSARDRGSGKAIANAFDEMVRGDIVPITSGRNKKASRPRRAQG